LLKTCPTGAEATLKRFWKTVGVETRDDAYAVTLDKRALKTPSGNAFRVPHEKSLVATLVAAEWENQETLIKPHALPLVGTNVHSSYAYITHTWYRRPSFLAP
jgi:ATP synthase mitochondrial F1 complex assembly factor 2